MGQPAAKKGDKVVATDIHIEMVPGPAGAPQPTPLPNPFTGILDGGLSTDVNIMGQPAAVVGSTATNTPSHAPKSGPFQNPPTNKATVVAGSTTVMIGGKPAARANDTASTCSDVPGPPAGKVVATGTVMIG